MKSAVLAMPHTTSPTFDNMIERFLTSRRLKLFGAKREASDSTIKNYRADLDMFFAAMRKKAPSGLYRDITREDVLGFIEYVQRHKTWKKASKLHVLRSLKAFFRWMTLDPEIEELDCKSYLKLIPVIGSAPSREWIPTRAGMSAFLEAFDLDTWDGLRDYTATALMLDAGPRIGDLCWLKLSDVKWEVARIRIPEDAKSKQGRLIPFNTVKMAPILRRYIKARAEKMHGHDDAGWLFITFNRGRCENSTFDQSFARHRKRTGLGISSEGNLTPHTIRHFFCTDYLARGGSIAELMYITGHKSLSTLQKYVHMAARLEDVTANHQKFSPLMHADGGYMGKKPVKRVRA